jgi:hypothetical protein
MEAFTESLHNFSEYPEKLVRHDALKHNIQAYRNRLDFQKDRLFDTKKPAVVDFLDLHDGQQGMASSGFPHIEVFSYINNRQHIFQRR